MDPIADMLIKIKNAQLSRKETVSFGYSKIKFGITAILENGKWIGGVEKRGRKNSRIIEVKLAYENDMPKISEVRRISKLSKRVYKSYKEIFLVKKGRGLGIYSTSKGLLTDRDARKLKVGGEALLEVW